MTLWAWVNLVLAGIWVALIYPTLRWWRDSVLWVALMSAYALVMSHVSAALAAIAAGK